MVYSIIIMWLVVALGIVVAVILMILLLKYGPLGQYYWWKIRYSFYKRLDRFETFDKKRRKECDKEVLCINENQLFYLKDIYNEQSGQFSWRWTITMMITNPRQIWLSHGPRQQFATALIKEFKGKVAVIHIGRLVQYSSRDREGLKGQLHKEFRLTVWKEEANKVYLQYQHHLDSYLQQLGEEMEHPLDNYRGRERDVARIASGELGVTHLLTNEGELYRSYNGRHAEIVFCEDTTVQAQNIRELWIKNSPCRRCSGALIRHFKYINNKPTLFIGNIYKLGDQEDYRAMAELLKEGFQLEIWRAFLEHNYNIRAEYTKTAKELQKIKQQAQRYNM